MVIEKGACSLAPAASVNIAVKLIVPGLVTTGVPCSVPPALSDNPVPLRPVADQDKGGVPPVPVNACW